MTDKGQLAKRVVEKMMEDDLFSQWMKIKVIEISEGYSKIKMELREEMTMLPYLKAHVSAQEKL